MKKMVLQSIIKYIVASIGVSLLSIYLFSCSQFPSKPADDSYALMHTDYTIRVNESIDITVLGKDLEYLTESATWTCDKGIVTQNENGIFYQAPSNPCLSKVHLSLLRTEDASIDTTFKFLVYRQYVILKADDFVADPTGFVSSNWLRYINFIQDEDIASGIGIVGNSLVTGNQQYAAYVRFLHKSKNFEIWNHGFTHYTKDYATKKIAEFYNKSEQDQNISLNATQLFAKDLSDITIHTFGAPGNAYDAVTEQVINNSPDIDVWLFGPETSHKFVLTRSCEIEIPLFKPNFDGFLAKYNVERPYNVLQVHPNKWDASDFNEFKRIIYYLKEQEVTFITPYDYYILSTTKENGQRKRVVIEE